MTDEEPILKAITDFVTGGDESDVQRLDQVLHPNYQNVQSGFFEKKGVFVIDKAKYLSLIKEKIFGGAARTITVQYLEENGDLAFAKVILESEQIKFISLITLIKDNNDWFVVGNYPHFEYKLTE